MLEGWGSLLQGLSPDKAISIPPGLDIGPRHFIFFHLFKLKGSKDSESYVYNERRLFGCLDIDTKNYKYILSVYAQVYALETLYVMLPILKIKTTCESGERSVSAFFQGSN